jgi:hypothetical protein
MTEDNVYDDTTDDYERLEKELITQDRDRTRVMTADLDRGIAGRLVNNLVDDGAVTPVPDERVLVHEPSGEAFNSILQLAVFHRGWTAAQDIDQDEQ